ncbi:hypothetical protein [Polaribacter sp. 20A6]|uniref:hypothetical protein n=1 Tax=Polaribacter sp. 20A6 TaxID=2687289 RepID=UPI0013FD2D17|nr:hypothetical protein [Polaribacter sp. 20A6]
MNRSQWALALTLLSAIIAHISVYVSNLNYKYIISAFGVLFALRGAYLLFLMRKTFSKIYESTDWAIKDKDAIITIPFKSHKKDNPSILFELFENDNWIEAVASYQTDSINKAVTISINNREDLPRVRITIK